MNENKQISIEFETVRLLVEKIADINNAYLSVIETSLANLSRDEIASFNEYLLYCIDKSVDISTLAESYGVIVRDTFKEQLYFQRHGHYRFSSYTEVADSVYMNDQYMNLYMHGLALTSYLWINHVALRRYYEESIKARGKGSYLEIGPGHGYYFMQAMKLSSCNDFLGVDLSPTSIRLSEDVISSGRFGDFNNYQLLEANFLEWESHQKYDYVVMSEVLEHVEEPLSFLLKIADCLSDNGTAFITTCINAPAIDHIFLFDSVESITEMIENAGLNILSEKVVPYPGLDIHESMHKRLPVNIGFELSKK